MSFVNREERHSASGEHARKRGKRGGKRNIIKEVMVGVCFSQDRSRRDDNTRTHRHLGATIVKLGQVKVRSVWDLLLGGRTGAGYRLGIIVLDCCRSISRGMRVPYAYPSGWSWRRHRFINRPDTREKCAFTTTLPASLYLAFILPFSLARSIFLFLDRCRSRCPLCQFREGGARPDGLLTLSRRSQERELGNYT